MTELSLNSYKEAFLSVDKRDGDPVIADQAPAAHPEAIDLLDDCLERKVVLDSSLPPGSGHHRSGPHQGHEVLWVTFGLKLVLKIILNLITISICITYALVIHTLYNPRLILSDNARLAQVGQSGESLLHLD